MKLILASQSPRRRMFLDYYKIKYDAIPSDYEEDMTMDLPLDKLAQELALGKAMDVANKVEEGLVIGGDTFVSIGGEILGKPNSKEEAKSMLKRLSGNINTVYSGVAVVDAKTKEVKTDYETTDVKFNELSEEEIDDYIKTNDPMDKAGSYGMQGIGGILIERIDGCYSNVVGLPLPKLNKLLKEFDYNLLKEGDFS